MRMRQRLPHVPCISTVRVKEQGSTNRDTQPHGTKLLSDAVKHRVLAKTATEAPPGAMQWRVHSMAAVVGIRHTCVQMIWV